MKLRHIFTALVASLAVFTACEEVGDHFLSEVQVSSSYVAISTSGGSTSIDVTANSSWSITDVPSWLTVNPASGSAGTGKIVFSADATLDGRNCSVNLVCNGQTQIINVIQGLSEVSPATCSDVIAGSDGKTYLVSGVCTSIANTNYGNWYLNDGTGEVYIYGTVDAGGNYNWASFGIEVGDEVTVEGPKTTYNGTVELVDVKVKNVNKSLIKCDSLKINDEILTEIPIEGGDFVAYLTCKGQGVSVDIPADAASWLSIVAIDAIKNRITFHAAPNEAGDRGTVLTFKTTDGKKNYTAEIALAQKGAIFEVSMADFNAAAVSSTQYKITGVIASVANASYGNVYVRDWSGEAYVYGIGAKGDFEKAGLKVGDIVTLVGTRGEYKGSAQMAGAQLESFIPVTEVTPTEFLSKPDSKDVYYMVTGTVTSIANTTYGNLYISDGTSDVYVYGVYPGYGASGDNRKNFLAAAGIEEGDTLTMIGYKDTYNGTIELCGGTYFKHEKGAAPEPIVDPETGDYGIGIAYELGESSYDDGGAVINGEEVAKVLKIGTSKKAGSITFTVPAGTKKLSMYAVAWKNAETTLTFSVSGDIIASQAIAANDGASNTAPYTITVTDSDKYSIELPEALAVDTLVVVSTAEGANPRAIMFGIKAE